MSKDLLVLADEYAAATATFARALALKDSADSMSPIAREAGDKRAALAEALAALDIAQPEPDVNAMLVEALKALLSWVDAYAETSDAEFPDIEAKAEAALTAAKQAQLARPINCGTGHCSCIECPYEQAQPERAPLSEAQVTVLLDSYYASDFGPDELIRKVEQLHGIKQGGQHD